MTTKEKYEFSPNAFNNKRLMSPRDYYLDIAEKAIAGGLMTKEEFELFTKNFRTLRYSPDQAVQLIDNLIKLRLREYRKQKEYEKVNKKVNKDDSFINEIIKTNEDKKLLCQPSQPHLSQSKPSQKKKRSK